MKPYRKKIDSLLPTKSNVQSTNISKFPEPDISNSKSYMFTRKLSGANVGDTYIQETILRKNGYMFNTGDLLQAQLDATKDSSYDFLIDSQVFNSLVKVDHSETKNDDIVCYQQVKVEYSDELHRNVISHYADGNPILVEAFHLQFFLLKIQRNLKDIPAILLTMHFTYIQDSKSKMLSTVGLLDGSILLKTTIQIIQIRLKHHLKRLNLLRRNKNQTQLTKVITSN